MWNWPNHPKFVTHALRRTVVIKYMSLLVCHIVGAVMAPRSTYGDHKGTRQTFDVRRKCL